MRNYTRKISRAFWTDSWMDTTTDSDLDLGVRAKNLDNHVAKKAHSAFKASCAKHALQMLCFFFMQVACCFTKCCLFGEGWCPLRGDGGVSQLQMSFCCPLSFSALHVSVRSVPFGCLSEFGYVIAPRKPLNAHFK